MFGKVVFAVLLALLAAATCRAAPQGNRRLFGDGTAFAQLSAGRQLLQAYGSAPVATPYGAMYGSYGASGMYGASPYGSPVYGAYSSFTTVPRMGVTSAPIVNNPY